MVVPYETFKGLSLRVYPSRAYISKKLYHDRERSIDRTVVGDVGLEIGSFLLLVNGVEDDFLDRAISSEIQ